MNIANISIKRPVFITVIMIVLTIPRLHKL